MTPRKTSISFAALLAVLGQGALAEGAGPASFCEQGYTMADANDDGMIDENELTASTDAEFAELDANSDGMISNAEYTDCRAGWTASMPESDEGRTEEDMAALDTNADGQIDQDEFMGTSDDQEYMARWGRMPFTDSVRDERGATAGEGQSAEARTDAATTGERTGADDGTEGMTSMSYVILAPRGDLPGTMSQDDMAARTGQVFLMLDTNNDRVVDRPEWVQIRLGGRHLVDSLQTEFEGIDADGSGDISPDEYAADRKAQWDWARSRAEESGMSSDVGAPVVYYRYPNPM